jgi:hypothetical protein
VFLGLGPGLACSFIGLGGFLPLVWTAQHFCGSVIVMVGEEKQGIIYLCIMRGYNQNLGMPLIENSHTAPKQLQKYFFWTSAETLTMGLAVK